MKNYYDFTGKKYLVTGASSGIGKATAIALSRQGATVVLIGRNEERLNETKSLMEERKHIIISCDLCRVDDMKEVFDKATEDGQKLDGIVHCAGLDLTATINSLNRDVFDEMMHINIYVLLDMLRLFAKKRYHQDSSSVVAISSIAASNPEKCQTVYATAKAGMNAAVQAMAQELVNKGMRINTIMPGLTRTPMFNGMQEQLGEEQANNLANHQLLGIAEPEEIANAIMFLLSDASSVITGRAMYTDSGTFY